MWGEGSIVSDSLVSCCAHYSFGANVAVGPVSLAQWADVYTLWAGGLCKFAVPDVNAYMGNSVTQRIEEYKIAGTQIAFGNRRSNAVLCFGGAGQGKTDTLEYVLGESWTIEARGTSTSSFVWNSDGFGDNCVHFGISWDAGGAHSEYHHKTQCCCGAFLF